MLMNIIGKNGEVDPKKGSSIANSYFFEDTTGFITIVSNVARFEQILFFKKMKVAI